MVELRQEEPGVTLRIAVASRDAVSWAAVDVGSFRPSRHPPVVFRTFADREAPHPRRISIAWPSPGHRLDDGQNEADR
jgi:hypothetical protein